MFTDGYVSIMRNAQRFAKLSQFQQFEGVAVIRDGQLATREWKQKCTIRGESGGGYPYLNVEDANEEFSQTVVE